MKKVAKATLASLLTFSVAACSSGESSTSSTDSQSSETRVQKDTFVYAIAGEPNYPDSAIAGDALTAVLTDLLVTPLFNMTEDGEAEGYAVDTYEVSEDGLTYTFHLKDGMKWSDGSPLTAYDYEFGLKHSLSIGVADASYLSYAAAYVLNGDKYYIGGFSTAEMEDLGYTALDETTLQVTLSTPCDFFPQVMMLPVFAPAKEGVAVDGDYTWADDVTNPTCGPYKLVSIDRSTEIVLEKNDEYLFADKVTTENVVIKVISDSNAQLLAYQNGEIDFANGVGNEVISIYSGQEDLIMPGGVINYQLRLNSGENGNEALKDVNVRKAIQMAVDRNAICTALDGGDLYVPLYGVVPVGVPGIDGDFRTEGGDLIVEDLEAAKTLMEEAGYNDSNRVTVTYKYNSSPVHDVVAQVLQQQLAQIYIDLELITTESRTFFDETADGLFETARSAFSADYMDATTYLDQYTSWKQSVITSGDAKYDELYKASMNELDHDARIQLLHDAEEYFISEMAYQCPLFQYGTVYLAKPGTEGITYTPQGSVQIAFVKVYE